MHLHAAASLSQRLNTPYFLVPDIVFTKSHLLNLYDLVEIY